MFDEGKQIVFYSLLMTNDNCCKNNNKFNIFLERSTAIFMERLKQEKLINLGNQRLSPFTTMHVCVGSMDKTSANNKKVKLFQRVVDQAYKGVNES